MKNLLASAALAGALTLTGVSAASALEQYPATPAQCGVGSGATTPGGSVTFSCTGMTPGETVDITVTCDTADATATGGGAAASAGTPVTSTGTAVAGADGSFSYSSVMTTAGLCTFTGVGAASGAVVTAQVTVAGEVSVQAAVASPVDSDRAPTDAGLAATGIDSSTALWGAAGVGALALGTAGVFLARRRNAASDAA